MISNRITSSIGLIVLVTVACSDQPASEGAVGPWQAVVDTVGDTTVVRTIAGSVWGDTIDLYPEVSIGVLDGAEEYLFGQVSAIAVSDDHTLYVTDRQVPVLRKYDAEGNHLANLGREGGGPGEYRQPDGGLVVFSDGRVVLRDPGNGRFAVFDRDDNFLDTWRHPSGGGFNTSRALYNSRGDTLYTFIIANLGVPVTEWEYALAKIGPDGETLDTLLGPTWDYDRPQVSGRSENSSSTTGVPFAADTHWAWSPLGFFIGSLATDYRIEVFRPGNPLRIEREHTPVPVIGAEGAERRRRIERNFKEQFDGWSWNGPPVPDTKPPIRSLLAGQDGRIWVQVSKPGYEALSAAEAEAEEERTGRVTYRYQEPVAFDVFDADGRFLGHVRAPDGFATTPTPVFKDNKVWAVVRDELDVARIVRFRLDLPPT